MCYIWGKAEKITPNKFNLKEHSVTVYYFLQLLVNIYKIIDKIIHTKVKWYTKWYKLLIPMHLKYFCHMWDIASISKLFQFLSPKPTYYPHFSPSGQWSSLSDSIKSSSDFNYFKNMSCQLFTKIEYLYFFCFTCSPLSFSLNRSYFHI